MTEFEHKTTENRFNAIIDLGHIIRIAESETSRSRDIPILDDEEHADLVQGYADRIHEIMLDMVDLANFGRRKE